LGFWGFRGLRFQLWGLGFWGFGVWGLGLGVLGLGAWGFGVWGLGFGVWGRSIKLLLQPSLISQS